MLISYSHRTGEVRVFKGGHPLLSPGHHNSSVPQNSTLYPKKVTKNTRDMVLKTRSGDKGYVVFCVHYQLYQINTQSLCRLDKYGNN